MYYKIPPYKMPQRWRFSAENRETREGEVGLTVGTQFQSQEF